jgi:hypothetical protein
MNAEELPRNVVFHRSADPSSAAIRAAPGGAVGVWVSLAIVVLVFSATVSARPLRVPSGFRATEGTGVEPYTGTGWAQAIVHEDSGLKKVL